MGKLNIAHHKSYHPYRRDNIERVRRDEEEARLQEAAKEGKMMLADAEARIEILRQKAGVAKRPKPRGEDLEEALEAQRGGRQREEPTAGPSSLTTPSGHINLFEDLEKQNMPILVKTTRKDKAGPATNELGIPLAPSEKDRKPWYSNKDHERNKEVDGDKRVRELARKSAHDPLTSINQQLSKTDDSRGSSSRPRPRPPSGAAPQVAERLTRESSERQRALELIARKRREMDGSATPSTVYGGMEGGYGDQYNRRDVEEAHRHRDRRDSYGYGQDDRRGGRHRW